MKAAAADGSMDDWHFSGTEVRRSVEARDTAFAIVGIGASAGGLAACEAFFSAMPADRSTGMAFVLVQHLAPDHKSILAEIIKSYTRMPVFKVEEGMPVRPDCTYIIPPRHDMALLNGTLHLLERQTCRGLRQPIDFFFRSLAQDRHERAIGIILSGSGSDGALGLRAIKGEGGMVMAQTPESAEYGSMPRSAIATGLVDYVLTPAAMPSRLISYSTHAMGRTVRPVIPPAADSKDNLNKIFVLLRAQTGHDFSRYKQNTINRRIERRMAVHEIKSLDEYVRYLGRAPTEVDALFLDILIGVTQFFRDPESFRAFQAQVVPRLLSDKPAGATVRVWVPGCSSGEEAYSIAIVLMEHIKTLERPFRLQVFATDIDSRAIEQARTGVYPPSITMDVSAERLAEFFVRDPDTGFYRVRKALRDQVVFAEQDVIRDSPFSKLDLISCRNLLIYLEGELQKKLIPLFHYALHPGGFLFLGNSESVGGFADLFATVDRKAKLYRRKANIHGIYRPDFSLLPVASENGAERQSDAKPAGDSKSPLREWTEQTLLDHCAAVAALINQGGDILYLHGRTGRYLEPTPGEAGMNILNMARECLRPALTAALHKAVARREPVCHSCLGLTAEGEIATVSLTVRPVLANRGGPPEPDLYLAILEAAPAREDATARTASGSEDPRIASLCQELRAKEEYLQVTNEELQTANEELRASNEELQSVNEELQSTNEELETSGEELQSVNEELGIINAELQTKVADLRRVNNDMGNLLAATGIGTVFLDRQMLIQRFTPDIAPVINLIPSDVGRPIWHFVTNLVGYNRLADDVQTVLDGLSPREVEVQTLAGAWYLLRIRPYRTPKDVIDGVVITFTDISEIKNARAKLQESAALQHLALVARDSRDAVTVQDMAGRILARNPAAQRMYGWSEREALELHGHDRIPENRRSEESAVIERLSRAEALEPYRSQRLTKDGHLVDVWLTASALVSDTGMVYAVATTERACREGREG